MKLISSIKHQAVVMFVGFTLGISALYLIMAVVAAFMVEDELLSRLLQQEANYIESVHRQTGVIPESRINQSSVYPHFDALPEFARRAIEQGISDNEIFTPDKSHYHIIELSLFSEQPSYLMVEVSSLLSVTNTPNVFQIFLFGFSIALLAAVVLAIKMAALTVKPVMSMVDAIEMKRKLPNLPFELGYLSKTMQKAFDRLSANLIREKNFTADVSHELRTPLTILNNTITLAEKRGLRTHEIRQLRIVGEQMTHTIEVLLALARQDHIEVETCSFEPILEQAAMDMSLAFNQELNLKTEIKPGYTLITNPNLLRLLVANLLNNAMTHSANKSLIVSASDNRIIFHNSSNNRQQKDWLKAGVKSGDSNGIGQGLYLVTRILQALNWQYQLKQSDKTFSLIISL